MLLDCLVDLWFSLLYNLLYSIVHRLFGLHSLLRYKIVILWFSGLDMGLDLILFLLFFHLELYASLCLFDPSVSVKFRNKRLNPFFQLLFLLCPLVWFIRDFMLQVTVMIPKSRCTQLGPRCSYVIFVIFRVFSFSILNVESFVKPNLFGLLARCSLHHEPWLLISHVFWECSHRPCLMLSWPVSVIYSRRMTSIRNGSLIKPISYIFEHSLAVQSAPDRLANIRSIGVRLLIHEAYTFNGIEV